MCEDNTSPIKLFPLIKRINAFSQGYRQNIVLIGQDTLEISHLLENYITSSKIGSTTYIHTSASCTDKKEFLKATAFSLLSNYTGSNSTLDSLINNSAGSLSLTVAHIKNQLRKTNTSFLDVVEIINKFNNETKNKCILIIEDFINLQEIFINFYQDFAKFIMLQTNCMVILATHNHKSANKVIAEELNLLFGNFEKIILPKTPSLDNLLYLKKIISPICPSPFFLSFFTEVIGTNLTYYSAMATAIKNTYHQNSEEDSIISAIQSTLYSKETYFFQKFSKKISAIKEKTKDHFLIVKLLIALSAGYLRKNELSATLDWSARTLNAKLQILADLNYVENLGTICKINDPLFSFWLNSIFRFHFSPTIFNPHQRISLYKRKMMENIITFKEDFFKSKIKKILQLFLAFQDDKIKLEKEKYHLPSIRKTKIISYPQNDFHIFIGEGKEIVFAGIKEENTQEKDIFDFIEKSSAIKGKRVKKIFISLGILPPTARTIAKNNKVEIWNINEVNRLFRIYNKPLAIFDNETADKQNF